MSEDLTPDQTDAVRRSLRAARHEEPLPDDVAARLDERLAGLVAERSAGAPADVAPVVPLRRRRWPAVLAAAAALTAIGLGGTQLLHRGDHADSLTTADRAEATAPSPSSRAGAGNVDGALDNLGGQMQLAITPEIRADLARAGIRHVRPLPTGDPALSSVAKDAAPTAPQEDARVPSAYAASAAACGATLPDDLPDGSRIFSGVRDAEPVLIVLRPEIAATLVTAYPCDGGVPTTLPLD
ncbi:hypothetical protein [Nocardioides jiangxiensis]|uniref:Uncharacterized protein n=1 Tax=Nocardioides jiangxiensis TaxID=3064524 RepID=A0ABT9B4X9_9ACTN|nr:hypothetical protein [Nocardioides sp. WY-20]MDO7868203.1 hypothetical protein [Nocardioides sp. WY-20]